jgi:acetyltransferase
MNDTIHDHSKPTHDILSRRIGPLDSIFTPTSVAVVGASETPGSIGHTIINNLLSHPHPGRKIYPVNPKRAVVLGEKAYPNISSIPSEIDLAVIATAAASVPKIIQECVDSKVKGCIVISAGFKEHGEIGKKLEQEILEISRRGTMRIIGPNCLGVMVPHLAFNATFSNQMAQEGNIGFISQSGALCTAILDWSLRENIGFSSFVSIGSMLDVSWGDLIDYFGDDPRTRSIVIYMESIGDARFFLSAAREVALRKPIILIKAGRTQAASQAAASHTGTLTGSDEVLDAAFRRVGVLRVDTIAELFNMVEVLAKQPRPSGPKLTIITNAGGPAVLATDMLITGGGELSNLTKETMDSLNQLLPAHWSHGNPIDILGDADPKRYAEAVKIAGKDPNSDGLLAILTPQAMTDPTATAIELAAAVKGSSKPILASWMGGIEVEKGETVLNQAGIPTFKYPDTAARAFDYIWRYSDNLRALYETPKLTTEEADPSAHLTKVGTILNKIKNEKRTILAEHESKQILAAYGIPTVETHIALTEDEAVKLGAKMDQAIVLKLHSKTVTHKTDVGGVKLNLNGENAIREAFRQIESSVREKAGAQHFHGVTVQPMIKLEGYELILGSSIDPQFGPVLLFGMGGQLVEVFKDRALGFPPLNTTLALRMMEQTKIYTALKGVRGRKAVDLHALEKLLVRFSQLVLEQPWIKEIDINPLIVSPEKILALDARIILHDSSTRYEDLPKPAIRPYPTQYITQWKLKNGLDVVLRPIRPEDENLMIDFHQTLSTETVYLRYFENLKLEQRVAHDRLTRICFNDYDRELALVAEYKDPKTGKPTILGVGRLSRLHAVNEAEFALIVSSNCQHQGLGTQLLSRLIQIGRKEKLDKIIGHILIKNSDMLQITKKLGFKLEPYDHSEWKAVLDLNVEPEISVEKHLELVPS